MLLTGGVWLSVWLALCFGVFRVALAQGAPLTPAESGERRVALVIGNSRYNSIPLSNPENDARLIAGNLKKLGFEVDLQLNLGVRRFRSVLREFARTLSEQDVAVLYYAGHGVQIDGRNYLLPVDVNIRDEAEVKDDSVDIEDVYLSQFDKARSRARIVILDACRDNPFAGKKTRNIRTTGGLAEMGARGTLIAFASAPGSPAEDGPDGANSVYSKSLAEEMMVPGLEVEQMFKNVRVKVLRGTRDRQIPWVNTSLTSNFSFNPLRGSPTEEAARQERIDRLEAELKQTRRALEESRTSGQSAVAFPAAIGASAPPPRRDTEARETRSDAEHENAKASLLNALARSESEPAMRDNRPSKGPQALATEAKQAPSVRGETRCLELLQRASIGERLAASDYEFLKSSCK